MVIYVLFVVMVIQMFCFCYITDEFTKVAAGEKPKPKPVKLKKKRKVQSKEVANRQIFMANLEAYDGTSSGQQDYIK